MLRKNGRTSPSTTNRPWVDVSQASAWNIRFSKIQSRDSGQRSALLQFECRTNQPRRRISQRDPGFVQRPARARHHAADSRFERPAIGRFSRGERPLQPHLPEPLQTPRAGFSHFNRRFYRFDGETLRLPEGYYTIAYTGGPEYLLHTKENRRERLRARRNCLDARIAGSIPPSRMVLRRSACARGRLLALPKIPTEGRLAEKI